MDHIRRYLIQITYTKHILLLVELVLISFYAPLVDLVGSKVEASRLCQGYLEFHNDLVHAIQHPDIELAEYS